MKLSKEEEEFSDMFRNDPAFEGIAGGLETELSKPLTDQASASKQQINEGTPCSSSRATPSVEKRAEMKENGKVHAQENSR